MIIILGPTASGKTAIGTKIAFQVKGEIISADSRQVYKQMDLGTGKDLNEYIVDSVQIPYHLIDICNAGTRYNLFRYKQDFASAYRDILNRNKCPLVIGGTGMYLDAIVFNYQMEEVPFNQPMRNIMKNKSREELINWLSSLVQLHNSTDTTDRNRLERAIEIAEYQKDKKACSEITYPNIIFGIHIEREELKRKIDQRIEVRMEMGMVKEVEKLMNESNISPDDLKYYGLEYRVITSYLLGELNQVEMMAELKRGIYAFAKKQMTWFRRMEKKGAFIHWIDGKKTMDEKMNIIRSYLKEASFTGYNCSW